MWHRLMENEYICEWTTLYFQSFHDGQYQYVSVYVPLSTKERTHVSQTVVLRINGGCCCLHDQFDDRSDDTSLLSNYTLLGESRQSVDSLTLGNDGVQCVCSTISMGVSYAMSYAMDLSF